MKPTTNLQRSISYLYKIYDALNEQYFDGKLLPRPIISIQGSEKSFAHFTPWNAYRIRQDNGEYIGNVEINISSSYLDRPIENTCASLLHEMVHYYCYLHKIKDTSNNHRYHNKKFKAEAEARGLVLEYASVIGWSITEPSEDLIDFIISCGFEDFRIGRNEFTTFRITGTGNHDTTGTTTTTTKNGNSHKLICPCCGTTVRFTTKKAPRLLCINCNKEMIEA